MRATLFRKEALAARSGMQFASTPLPLPPGVRVLVALAALIAAALVALLLFGEYAPRDSVRGYVTTSAGDLRVHAAGAGTISRLIVREGDAVSRGDSLLLLRTSRTASRSAAAQDAVLAALQAEKSALESEKLNLAGSLEIQLRRLQVGHRRFEQRLELLHKQLQILAEAESIAKRELERLSSVHDYVSTRELDAATANVQQSKLQQQQLALEIQDTRMEIERSRSMLDEFPWQRDLQLAELDSSLQRLETRLVEARGFSEQTVTAPADGIVTGLLVKAGQTVSPSSTLLSIVPDDGMYEAELLIPTRTIAFVKSGAKVRIRYDALPHQKFGTFTGVLRSVSRTTTLPADKQFPMAVAEAVYLARAELDPMLEKHQDLPELQAGMTFTADIMRDTRRLAEWLFAPVIGASSRL